MQGALKRAAWLQVFLALAALGLSCAGHSSASSSGGANAGGADAGVASASGGGDAATSALDAGSAPLLDAGPTPVVDAGVFSESVELLASKQDNPLAIAVDAHNVYWLNVQYIEAFSRKLTRQVTPASVLKCSLSGCADRPTVLASDRVVSEGAAFAIDDHYVYWSDDNASSSGPSLVRCALDGCNGTPEVLGTAGAEYIALNDTSIFGTKFAAQVFSCAKGLSCGSSVDVLWSAGTAPVATGIALDANGVYWGTEATVQLMHCPFSGCGGMPSVLMPQPNPIAQFVVFALGPDTVYMADSNPQGFGAVYSCPKSGCAGGPTLLANGLDQPLGIAVDEANVYWVENAALQRCSVGGCDLRPTTLLATNAYPRALALDAQNIYLTIASARPGEGEIWRMAKPAP